MTHPNPHELIADLVEGKSPQPEMAAGDDGRDEEGQAEAGDACDALGPSDTGDSSIDLDVVKACAALDHSDTDNGQRLIAHFGKDLTVREQGGVAGGDWLGWEGRYWDIDGGDARVTILAQKIGGRIALEAEYLTFTPQERQAVDEAAKFAKDDEGESAKAAFAAAKAAQKALKARKLARWRHGVTSKNAARIEKMMAMAAPHLRRKAEEFNRDPYVIVCQNATLRLRRRIDMIDGAPDADAWIVAEKAFSREDYVTGLVPCDYDALASAPKWEAFLARCMPNEKKRRTLQQYSGTGLLGVLLQRLMFHHGFGANGKSVFLAVIAAVIGKSYGVSLPKETILGQGERGAGQASPDIVRLFGKRFVRIDELKDGESLREDLVKRLTGGDEMAVRNLFKGYFDFVNLATPHMSGNGFPRIDGTDNGIWRRVLVMHWEVTIPEAERREFDEFVEDLLTERSGILNWLLAGALDYMRNGLFIADEIAQATAEYQEEMNPIGEFIKDCVEAAPGESIGASAAYQAYVSWSLANAKRPRTLTAFGKEMHKHYKRDDKRTRSYLDCRLHDVPSRPDEPAKGGGGSYPEGYGG
jgi:putative DNA primase/helicase